MILSMFALDVRSAIEPKRVTNGTRTKHGFKSVFNPWLKFLRIVEPGKSDLLYSSRSAVTYCITTERDESRVPTAPEDASGDDRHSPALPRAAHCRR